MKSSSSPTGLQADKVIAGVAQRAQALRRLVMDVNSRKDIGTLGAAGKISATWDGLNGKMVIPLKSIRRCPFPIGWLVKKEGLV